MRPRLTRRRFFGALAGGAAGVLGGAAYAHEIEPGWLEVHRVDVLLGATEKREPVRILHLSDLHASPVVPLEFIAKAVALGLAQRPDVIALTGDYFTRGLDNEAELAAVLRPLAAAAPTFAVLGNHDGGRWAKDFGGYPTTQKAEALLAAAGARLLKNACVSLTVRGRPFQFIGVGDYWNGDCRTDVAFAATPPRGTATRVVLNHNPDAKDLLKPFDWDLVLCGHTHGGQLRVPLLGTPFAPVRDKRYVEGLHRWENRWLYVTHGVGNLHGLRLNCRPQVSVLDLG